MVTFADDYNLKPGQRLYTAYLWKEDGKYYVTFIDSYLGYDRSGEKSPRFDTATEALAWAQTVCDRYVANENAAGRKVAMPEELDNGDVGPVVKIVDISVIDKIAQKEEEADARTVTQFDHG